MPDFGERKRLRQCLDLCTTALRQSAGDQSHVLTELRRKLTMLLEDPEALGAPVTAPEATSHEPHEPVITMDMAGYITGWNRGAQRLFGYLPEEAIGQHILFLYAEEPGKDNGEIHELFLDYGSPLIEVKRRKKSGETFRANLALTHVLDENNEPVGMAAHLSEITDRLSEQEKHRLHARIIEDSDQGIMITDNQERIVSVNAAFSRITGYSAAEAIGQTPDLLQQLVADVMSKRVVESGKAIDVEHQQRAMIVAAPGRGQRLFDKLMEQRAVGQASQVVVVDQVAHPLLGRAQHAGIGED